MNRKEVYGNLKTLIYSQTVLLKVYTNDKLYWFFTILLTRNTYTFTTSEGRYDFRVQNPYPYKNEIIRSEEKNLKSFPLQFICSWQLLLYKKVDIKTPYKRLINNVYLRVMWEGEVPKILLIREKQKIRISWIRISNETTVKGEADLCV